MLNIICQELSVHKVEHLVSYLKREFKSHITSEDNLSKLDGIITAVVGGFSENRYLRDTVRSVRLLSKMTASVTDDLK
jgi:tRNA A37 threonylcarbamoyltransferase TsaD